MLKKNWTQHILIAIITLLVVVSTSLLVKGFFSEVEASTASLYYVSNDFELIKIIKNIEADEADVMVEDVLNNLYLDVAKENLKASIPAEIEIIDVDVKNNVASINFSNDFNNLNNQEKLLARGSIVWSLTSLDFIQGVIIKVNDVVINSETNKDFGVMNKQNMIINDNLSTNTTSEYQIVNLYFSDNFSEGLVAERRLIAVEANKPQERTILEQLIGGPQSNHYLATIPKETKINDVITTIDGVCYVNLNYEFVSKHSGGENAELLTIYSIVNSLCQLNHVSKVQFLIDGERLELYKGFLDFSKPFEAMELLI